MTAQPPATPEPATPEAGTDLQRLPDRWPRRGRRPAIGVRRQLAARWWTYERLFQEVEWRSAFLAARPYQVGDPLLLWAPDSPEWVGWLFAGLRRGLTVILLDAESSAERLRVVVEQCRPRLLIHGRFQDPGDVGSGIDRAPVADRSMPGVRTVGTLEAVDADQTAVVLYTSGTGSSTAEPRGVRLSHRNLAAQLLRFARWRVPLYLLRARLMTLAPLSHSQGLLLGALIPLSIGLSVLHSRSRDPAYLMRAVREERVFLVAGVPRIFALLAQALRCQPLGRRRAQTVGQRLDRDPPGPVRRHHLFWAVRRAFGWRFWIVIVGGAPLSEALERFWRDTGNLLIQGYGLTETAAMASINGIVTGRRGSVGRPVGHVQVRIAEDGEILVRGTSVARSYWHDPQALDEDGFLHTGDLGALRGHHLFVFGRKDDLIVTGEGHNVQPADVEAVLDALPGVRGSAVIGRETNDSDIDTASFVHAVLALDDPSSDAAAIIADANLRLETHQRIVGWSVWPQPDLPRSRMLEPRRRLIARALEQQAAGSTTLPAHPTKGLDAILALADHRQRLRELAHFIVHRAGRDERKVRLSELGLGSLDVVALLFLLEAEVARPLQRALVQADADIGDLHRLATRTPDPTPDPKASPADAYQAPAWSRHPLLHLPRVLLRAPMAHLGTALYGRLEVAGLEHLDTVEPPAVFLGLGHRHPVDVTSITAALPRRWRRSLAFIASRFAFGHLIDPPADLPFRQRLAVGIVFGWLAPLLYPFVLLPRWGASREGLLAAGRLVTRGLSPIVFGGTAGAMLAAQAGLPLIPVDLDGPRDHLWTPGRRRPVLRARFGAPRWPDPEAEGAELRDWLGSEGLLDDDLPLPEHGSPLDRPRHGD